VEMLVWRKTRYSWEITNELYAIEPTNEENFIQKLISILKETNMIRRLNY
jgi:hypothetical protein